MSQDPRRERHLRLVTRMADAIGADLETECYSGRLGPDDLDALVDRCTGCTDPDGCARQLGAPGTRLEAPPAQCRNAETLLRLVP